MESNDSGAASPKLSTNPSKTNPRIARKDWGHLMSMSTTSTLDSLHPITDRARKHKDGSVLLSIAEDRVCKL
ncbi:MAG TPA: hypothetical protein VFS90_00690, partial [Pyrinomonadaceae bacterium]|nr:hypothetical protein [Pyrinomonadaceae bacterium]